MSSWPQWTALITSHLSIQDEVMLALVGHLGSLCQSVHSSSSSDTSSRIRGNSASPVFTLQSISVDPSSQLSRQLSSSQKTIIDRQLQLAVHYLHLQLFVESHSHSLQDTWPDVSVAPSHLWNAPSALYRVSMARALEPVLRAYENTVLQAAVQMQQDETHHLTAWSTLQCMLQPFHTIFPALRCTVQHMEQSAVHSHGGVLLTYLYHQAQNGFPLIAAMYAELLHKTQHALYQQTEAWLVHGVLLDPYQEFFIAVRKHTLSDIATTSFTLSSESSSYFLNPHTDSRDYMLRLSMQPQYWPLPLLRRILFIGQAVIILKQQQHEQAQHNSRGLHFPNRCMNKFDAEAKPLWLFSVQVQQFLRDMTTIREQSTFQIEKFERAVAPLHELVTAELSEFLLQKSRFMSYLLHLQSFYLCTNSEFYHQFFTLSDHIADGNQCETELQVAFNKALYLSELTDLDFITRVANTKPAIDHYSFMHDTFSHKPIVRTVHGDNMLISGSSSTLICCDSARLLVEAKTIALTSRSSDDRGSVWAARRQTVKNGFATTFSVVADDLCPFQQSIQSIEKEFRSPGDTFTSKLGFAFLIHSDYASHPFSPTYSSTLGRTFVGICRCLIVEFVQTVKSSHAQVASFQVFVHSVGAEENLSTSLTIATCDWPLFDGQEHTVKIRFIVDRSFVSTAADADASGILTITIDEMDKPLIVLSHLDLSQLLSLERGQAHVGFVSATPSHHLSPDLLKDRHARVALCSWHWNSHTSDSNGIQDWASRIYLTSSWPSLFSLVMPGHCLDWYQTLHAFLFHVLRCHHRMRLSTTLLKHLRMYPIKVREQARRVLALRTAMSHFCQALHDHCFVDILYPLNQRLVLALRDSHSYPLVRAKHITFVQSLMDMTFRGDRLVSSLLDILLAQCMKWAQSIAEVEPFTIVFDVERSQSQLHQLFHDVNGLHAEFERTLVLLFTVLTRKNALKTSTKLDQLILRLDFNFVFSQLALKQQTKRIEDVFAARRGSTSLPADKVPFVSPKTIRRVTLV